MVWTFEVHFCKIFLIGKSQFITAKANIFTIFSTFKKNPKNLERANLYKISGIFDVGIQMNIELKGKSSGLACYGRILWNFQFFLLYLKSLLQSFNILLLSNTRIVGIFFWKFGQSEWHGFFVQVFSSWISIYKLRD